MRFAMITLNPVDPAVRYALADRGRLHAIISASCTGRPLWRWERDRIHLVANRIDTDRLTARLGPSRHTRHGLRSGARPPDRRRPADRGRGREHDRMP